MFLFNATIKSYVSKDIYKEMNLGTREVPKIQVHVQDTSRRQLVGPR